MAADGSRRYGLGVESRRGSEVTAQVAPLAVALAADRPTLDELAVAISQVLQPGLDPIEVLAEIDLLAAECPTPTRDGVMQHLFGSGLFEGDRADYHHWRNSCIDHVISTRRGMPITLSVVAIEVARRVGVTLAGVGMPGHFLVGDPTDPDWFADPFHGRTALGRQDCRELMVSMGMARWSEGFLRTIPPRLVAARILNNVKFSCERRSDEVRLAVVMQARQLLPELGDDPVDAQLALAVLN
jgi:regulator of sirC expression with transglutaminase-like and TPR domain